MNDEVWMMNGEQTGSAAAGTAGRFAVQRLAAAGTAAQNLNNQAAPSH